MGDDNSPIDELYCMRTEQVRSSATAKKGGRWVNARNDPDRIRDQSRGALDEDWVEWFDGLAITIEHAGDGLAATTLTGPVADQSALRGMLSKLWDLNLTLISVRRIEDRRGEGDD